MPFKVETCLRNKKFFMIVVNVKMVLSLLENINLAPKIVFRYVDDIKTFEGHQVGLEVGEWEDEVQRGLGEGGEGDQHDSHAEDRNRAQEDARECPQRTEVRDGDLPHLP